MQPSEFWALSLPEADALSTWMADYIRRQNEAQRG
jgi:hypothetical protein